MLDPTRLLTIAASGHATEDECRLMAKSLLVSHYRRSDPETSAQGPKELALTESRKAVLWIFEVFTSMTDAELATHYERMREAHGLPKQSSSGLRTRRRELVDMGRLMARDTVVIRQRKHTVWGIVA